MSETKTKNEHVVISGNGFACLRCGETYLSTMPVSTGIILAISKAFEKDHARCPVKKEVSK